MGLFLSFCLHNLHMLARLDTGASQEDSTYCIFYCLLALASPSCHVRNGDLWARSSEKEKALVLLSVLD